MKELPVDVLVYLRDAQVVRPDGDGREAIIGLDAKDAAKYVEYFQTLIYGRIPSAAETAQFFNIHKKVITAKNKL